MKKSDNRKNFTCLNCKQVVTIDSDIGTAHRNHCPFCLWSKHVDESKEGDRKSTCQSLMEPIGLTFKKEKPDKYHLEEKGELMLIHQCLGCGKISLNRLAADDEPQRLLELVNKSSTFNKKTKEKLKKSEIYWLSQDDEKEVRRQLFGNKIL